MPDDPEKPNVYTTLANLPADAMLTAEAMAEAVGVTPHLIAEMVSRYDLPPPIKVGSRRIWFAGNVLGWLRKEADELTRKHEMERKRVAKV